MMSISEAITTIKKAENDADKLIEEAKERSVEMKEESREKVNSIIQEAKDEANEETDKILIKAEEDAKRETINISNHGEEIIRNTKNQSKGKIEEAVEIIVQNIL